MLNPRSLTNKAGTKPRCGLTGEGGTGGLQRKQEQKEEKHSALKFSCPEWPLSGRPEESQPTSVNSGESVEPVPGKDA